MLQFLRQPRWLLLLIALVALITAACGDDDEDDASDVGGSATVAATTSISPTPTTSMAGGDASPTMGMGGGMAMDHDMDGTPGTSADMDLMFLDGMVPHHQSAVDMAEIALEEGEQEEVKTLAQAIITSQESEIEQMMAWRDEWFPGAPEADMSSMGDMAGMNMSESDMQTLRDADPFDKAFLEAMIPHHQSAVTMAEMVRTTTERPEIKQLAEAIIAAQEAEIEQMQGWLAEWFGE